MEHSAAPAPHTEAYLQLRDSCLKESMCNTVQLNNFKCWGCYERGMEDGEKNGDGDKKKAKGEGNDVSQA